MRPVTNWIALALLLLSAVSPSVVTAQPRAPNPNAGTITGLILTRDGAPAAAVRVSVVPAPRPGALAADGQQYYEFQNTVATGFTGADGRYRLGNLPAGRYLVFAGLMGQATYYPAALEPDQASAVEITPGSTSPIDIKLVMPLGGRVQGRVNPVLPNANNMAVLSGVRLGELLELPVKPDGTFEFGYVPNGEYLLSLFPTPPGLASLSFTVGNADVTTLTFNLPSLHNATGRIVVDRGPLPTSFLAFETEQSYVPAVIKPDGTFAARVHAARHQVQLAGLPAGYAVSSIRLGTADASKGVDIASADVAGIVINVTAPRDLPRVGGTIAGRDPRLASATVEMTGPILTTLATKVNANGSFEFPAVRPGVYTLKVPQVPEIAPQQVVVTSSGSSAIRLVVPPGAAR